MSRPSRGRFWIIATLLLVIIAAALAVPAWQHIREAPPNPSPALRISFWAGDEFTIGGGPDHPFGLALSSDGRRLAFAAARHGVPQLWVRDLGSGRTDALPGTEAGVQPFWAPDGNHLGFFSGGRLRAFSFATGELFDLAEATAPRGGAWHVSGDIVFAPKGDEGLYTRRAADGAIERFGSVDTAAGELSHRFPVVTGSHVVFFVRAADSGREGLWIAPLDAPANRQRLTPSDAHGVVVEDWLLYLRDEALLAQQIAGVRDAGGESPRLTGQALLLGTPVGHGPLNQLFVAAAKAIVIYGAPQSGLRELRWMDRQGQSLGAVGSNLDAWDLRIAPDGKTIAVTQTDAQLGTLDVWAYDGDRPLPRRISPAIDADEHAVWSRDATRLAWVTGRRTIAIRGALAELPEERVHTFDSSIRVWDWSPDSAWIVLTQTHADTRDDIWLLSPQGDNEPTPFAQVAFNQTQAVVSPDGHWLAYASDESGAFEIYVDSFPTPGRRARLTSGGGSDPRWRADGAEIYFRRGREIHAVVPNLAATTPEASSSQKLFDAPGDVRAYDVAADGQRFLLNLPATDASPKPFTVIVNWQPGK